MGSFSCRCLGRCFTVMFALCLLVGPSLAAGPEISDSRDVPRVQRVEMDDETLDRMLALHHTAHESVGMVLLPAAVTDKKGRPVRDLAISDFQLFENAAPQSIRYFSSDTNEPVSIAFLLDLSGSMRQLEKLEHAKEAIRFFVDALEPQDQFALIGFADRQVSWITEFTQDRERFLERLSVQVGLGQTALHDAVAAAPGLVDERIEGRKAIVLITDGVDNHSGLAQQTALQLAREVNVPIYTIGFLSVNPKHLPKGTVEMDLQALRSISDETGGRIFAVHDPDELKEAVNLIDDELRFQYVIGYYPDSLAQPGEFRRLQLEGPQRLAIRTRSGYLGSR